MIQESETQKTTLDKQLQTAKLNLIVQSKQNKVEAQLALKSKAEDSHKHRELSELLKYTNSLRDQVEVYRKKVARADSITSLLDEKGLGKKDSLPKLLKQQKMKNHLMQMVFNKLASEIQRGQQSLQALVGEIAEMLDRFSAEEHRQRQEYDEKVAIF